MKMRELKEIIYYKVDQPPTQQNSATVSNLFKKAEPLKIFHAKRNTKQKIKLEHHKEEKCINLIT